MPKLTKRYTIMRLHTLIARATAVVAAIATIACSSNEPAEDNGKIPEQPNVETRIISKIIVTDEANSWWYSFTLDYDEEGRFRSITQADDYSYTVTDMEYTDNTIELTTHNSLNHTEQKSWRLNDWGYVTFITHSWYTEDYDDAGELKQSYEYDDNGYIKVSTTNTVKTYYGNHYDEVNNITYTWSNGNIVGSRYTTISNGVTTNNVWNTTYAYNDKPMNVVNLDINAIVECSNYDIQIWNSPRYGLDVANGLFGKTNSNFITKTTSEAVYGFRYDVEYEWTYDEEGYPTSCKVEYSSEDTSGEESEETYLYKFEYLD